MKCPCKATTCSKHGKCDECRMKHRNSRTACVKYAVEDKKENLFCPKSKNDELFGKCWTCREQAEIKNERPMCQEIGHRLYNEQNPQMQ
ncbi:hypothetical protein [Ilyobacter sp.]|jgi:hypothetical protein|uniref:hypothetical protein n=1 Tax=Ilyobacter sp. TaxID=3100343 RepID=UPI00356663C8